MKKIIAIALLAVLGLTAPAFAAPGRIGVVTTLASPRSTGLALDVVRYSIFDVSAVGFDTKGKIEFAPAVGIRPFKNSGVSFGFLKLAQPTPTPGANRFGTYGVFVETRI
jgi:hypothetical protein